MTTLLSIAAAVSLSLAALFTTHRHPSNYQSSLDIKYVDVQAPAEELPISTRDVAHHTMVSAQKNSKRNVSAKADTAKKSADYSYELSVIEDLQAALGADDSSAMKARAELYSDVTVAVSI